MQLSDIGKPTLFSIDTFLDVVEQLICSDEVEKALYMLDHGAPAYYEELPTERMNEIRASLHRQLWTPIQYKNIYDELEFKPGGYWPLRAQLLEQEIAKANEKSFYPLVMELAPGGLFLNDELTHKGLKFSYMSKGLDGSAGDLPSRDTSPNIFAAYELIEHLSNPWEIYQNYLKFGREADIVMISTPLFTYGGGMDRWRERPLGHLKCFSPRSLHAVVSKMFQGYEWTMTCDDTIVIVGRR